MSLKLADDSADVVALDVYNFQGIASCARRWAEKLERERPELTRVVVLSQWTDGISIDVWGDNTASGYELVGIIEAAKLRAHEANVLGEE